MTENVTIPAKIASSRTGRTDSLCGVDLAKTVERRPLSMVGRALSVIVMLVVLSFSTSCDLNRTTNAQYQAVGNRGWNKLQSYSFVPQWPDTAAARTYNLSVAIRHTGEYSYRNLALMVDLIDTTATGDGRVDRRTVNFTLADRYGNWLGSGFGDVYQSSVVVAQNVDRKRVHRIVIWHGMKNVETLNAVTDVGVILSVNK